MTSILNLFVYKGIIMGHAALLLPPPRAHSTKFSEPIWVTEKGIERTQEWHKSSPDRVNV